MHSYPSNRVNPRSEKDQIRQTVAHLGDGLRGLLALIAETEDLQWQRPPGASNETGRGQMNVASDPTGEAAVDPRRLSVRHQRKRAVRELHRLERHINTLRGDLARALEAWG